MMITDVLPATIVFFGFMLFVVIVGMFASKFVFLMFP
jgi:hypothetical protein